MEKRDGTYRARYYDPLGRRHSKTFTRKASAACKMPDARGKALHEAPTT